MRRTTAAVIPAFVCLYVITSFAQSTAEALYEGKCASCHGKDGKGKTAFARKAAIPDLASPAVQSMSDKDLYESIALGTHHKEYPHAFALRGMSQGEINSLVKKIREFAKK